MLKVCKKLTMVFLITICLLASAGCVEQKQLEKLALITASGFDLEKENVIRGTVVIHKFDPLAQNVTKVISAVANTSRGIKINQNLQSNQKLVSGQMRCVVYSKELAKKGIIQLVDSLNRDATVGNMVYLAVSDGTASSIMNMDQKNPSINLGTYLYNLIKQNVESEQILSPTLQEFNHDYYDIGKDPALPFLKIKNNDVIISGMGLFKDDKMVTVIKPARLFYLKILSEKYKAGSIELGFNRNLFKKIQVKTGQHAIRNVYSKIYFNIDNIESKSKIELVDMKNLNFKVNVKLNSRLLETTEPLEVAKPANVQFIEKKINHKMEKEIENLLTYFQQIDVDPVGFGNEYKTHLRGKNLTKKEWRRLYKQASFDVHVHNTIIRTGVVD